YKPTAHGESVIEFMLYALWDLGFKVGHASRTLAEAIKLAREDMTIRTSILEARRLTGDKALAGELMRRFQEEVVRGAGAEFIAAKLRERDERHARAGASRYMVEPNVKEGKGGLRDLHTLFWIARYLHPADNLEAALELELFEKAEVRAFTSAFDFLEAVRAHLHFAAGRPEERLTFDMQPEVARRMGYHDRPRRDGDNTPAVERFMRRYFVVAKEVGSLTRTFAAKLEAEHLKAAPSGLSRGLARLLPRQRPRPRPLPAKGFHEEGGRLSIDGPHVFAADPVNLLRLFHLADARDLDLHPDAFAAASRAVGLINPAFRRTPSAAKVFLDLLARGRNAARALELMSEARVLGRYIPEFGRIVGQMQFNMYHSYTVDEHSLRAVGILGDIAAGRLEKDHPIACQVLPLIEDKEALFLAMLLHDTGKGGAGGQERAGARAARTACERLGLEAHRISLVAWLVEHHLAMSDFAQKRDVADPSTIAAFAALSGDPERLRMLLALTIADIRAVGPGVWNGWKGELLRSLYLSTEAVFRGGRSSDAAGYARRRREAVAYDARLALIAADPEARSWAQAMEDSYFVAFSMDDQVAHLSLSRRASESGGAAAEATIPNGRNAAEVVAIAQDRRALFADLALAVAEHGGNVVGARIYTSKAGEALDVFHVQDASGAPFGADDPGRLGRLAFALEKAGRGSPPARPARRRFDLSRTSAFFIAPNVAIDNEASASATVIEVSGRDRPGLLEALARALSEAGFSILSAHIENYGERAVDAFYVDCEGGKLRDPARAKALRSRLTEILSAPEAAPLSGPARLKARASIGR
ncbi:MAG: [protein-PII] uridylyltransferase, partial [Caulobacteraceae bacterium]